jgi:phosphoglycerate dehydrogenase-like enzyme
MKAILHYSAGPRVCSILTSMATQGLDVVVVRETDSELLRKEIADCEVLLHVLKPVTADLIAVAPKLSLIQKIGIGVDTIDLQAAKARGIAVCNMPGTNTQAVVELTLALMLASVRRLTQISAETKAGRGWSQGGDLYDGIREISGCTVGLLGYGAIPRRLAPVLRTLGARVVAYSHTAPDDETPSLSLDELLASADIVSLHLPLTSETDRILDSRRIAQMKKGAILINTARGGLVDESALVSALRSGQISAAGLDVFADEPTAPTNALLSFPNVITTPHIAWLTAETWRRSFVVALENSARLRSGEALLHRQA